MKNIKVIMCDIDGTLLNSKGIVTPKTIRCNKESSRTRNLVWNNQQEESSKCKKVVWEIGNWWAC